MENRSVDHLGDVGAVARGAGIRRQCGETDLVVHHKMNGAASAVALELGHVECLRNDALADEGGITMNENRDHFFAFHGILENPLTGAGLAFDDRVHRFQMAGVCRETNLDLVSAWQFTRGLVAEVVFHIPVAAHQLRIEAVLKFVENKARGLVQEIGQHIQSSAVRHAHDDFEHAEAGAILKNGIERKHERLSALKREAFLANVFCVNERLECFGLVDFAQNIAVQFGRVSVSAASVLYARCDPLADFGIFDMEKLHSERVGVGLAKGGDHFAQRHLASLLEMTR